MSADMRSSWLVQRLEPPASFGQLGDNPFSFGGGRKNGGLSDEAMRLIRNVWSFDYMGAAEFEFGAVPKALSRIAQSDSLAAYEFVIDGTSVYVLCPGEWGDEVRDRIEGWAAGNNDRLKEGTRLRDALRPDSPYRTEICGWLELDNGFMFFTDRTMWEGACSLFGVKCEATS